MKSYKVKLSYLLILTISYLLNVNASYGGKVDFDGNGGFNFNSNTNIPMPATPSPPPSSESNDNSPNTYTKPKTHPKHSSGSLLTPQMRNDIVDSVYAQMQAQAKQKALEAKKQAEEAEAKKKQEEAKKKKEAQNWIRDYQADTNPKIDNIDTPLKSLDDSDPVRNLKGSYVPPMGYTKNPANDEFKVPKLEPQTTPVSNVPKTNNSDLLTPGKTEGELREMYYGSDREIMQCASGKKECSPEYVKALQMKRLTAEQGLTIHYNYKEVNGNFIKKPR